ncbi:hypothetical protein BJX96DRAFT_87012 [Aspergillus floccosus]
MGITLTYFARHGRDRVKIDEFASKKPATITISHKYRPFFVQQRWNLREFPLAVVATLRKRQMAGPAARRIKERVDKPFVSANRTRPGSAINQPEDERMRELPLARGPTATRSRKVVSVQDSVASTASITPPYTRATPSTLSYCISSRRNPSRAAAIGNPAGELWARPPRKGVPRQEITRYYEALVPSRDVTTARSGHQLCRPSRLSLARCDARPFFLSSDAGSSAWLVGRRFISCLALELTAFEEARLEHSGRLR